jgi:excisionase family DNA binding protein
MENENTIKKPFATVKEAAKITGISEHQIRLWLKAKQISYISCGNKYMINVSGLLRFLDEESAQNCRGCQ